MRRSPSIDSRPGHTLWRAAACDRLSAQAQQAFTLIEVMLVVVIMALVAGGASYGFGAMARAELRSSCLRILAAARYAHHRALIEGTVVRVLMDMDRGTIALEESDTLTALNTKVAQANDSRRTKIDYQGSVDPWQAAKARIQTTFKPKKATSPFHLLTNAEGVTMSRAKPHPLGRGIRIVRVFSPHAPKPETRGKSALYFFPGGRGEHTVVQLKNDRGVIYSVELWPLSARGRVIPKAVEPRELTEADLGLGRESERGLPYEG